MGLPIRYQQQCISNGQEVGVSVIVLGVEMVGEFEKVNTLKSLVQEILAALCWK